MAGKRHAEPVGTWTLYLNREPIGEVTVVSVTRRRCGARMGEVWQHAADKAPQVSDLRQDGPSGTRILNSPVKSRIDHGPDDAEYALPPACFTICSAAPCREGSRLTARSMPTSCPQ
ncbi:hypothetical protein FDG2_0001 [Candidatus Protofrankia californiensis]|uniref:Uncharacterized protein n=1 Tax=Candidatus Protofrankia californiensis TaxID=1839754 RepID=A0A1C3NSM3_9ACTN|nr:hypothetical protein FDG2_0001 [Candidatus Protofrankia californiensis]